ncbi:hypothetical protein EDC01DRAFT_630631 [Geopyxis carbonaria]|nr:hypothetical protein EDC01DRAFT_630631 [Geopyxis carbonaria]
MYDLVFILSEVSSIKAQRSQLPTLAERVTPVQSSPNMQLQQTKVSLPLDNTARPSKDSESPMDYSGAVGSPNHGHLDTKLPPTHDPMPTNTKYNLVERVQSMFFRICDGLKRKPMNVAPEPETCKMEVLNTQQLPKADRSGGHSDIRRMVLQDANKPISFASMDGSSDWRARIIKWSQDVSIALAEEESNHSNTSNGSFNTIWEPTVVRTTDSPNLHAGNESSIVIGDTSETISFSTEQVDCNSTGDETILYLDDDEYEEMRKRSDKAWVMETKERSNALVATKAEWTHAVNRAGTRKAAEREANLAVTFEASRRMEAAINNSCTVGDKQRDPFEVRKEKARRSATMHQHKY